MGQVGAGLVMQQRSVVAVLLSMVVLPSAVLLSAVRVRRLSSMVPVQASAAPRQNLKLAASPEATSREGASRLAARQQGREVADQVRLRHPRCAAELAPVAQLEFATLAAKEAVPSGMALDPTVVARSRLRAAPHVAAPVAQHESASLRPKGAVRSAPAAASGEPEDPARCWALVETSLQARSLVALLPQDQMPVVRAP